MKTIKSSKTTKIAHITDNGIDTLCKMTVSKRWVDCEDVNAPICPECQAKKIEIIEALAAMTPAPTEDWYVPSSDEEIFAPVPAKVETEFKLLGSEWSDKKGYYTYRVIETGSNGAVRLEQTNCKVSYKRWTTEAALAKYYKQW